MQPRTRAEAEAAGWQQLSGCSEAAVFLGERYGHPEDDSLVLIYDAAGYIAGSQSVVAASAVDTSLVDMSRQPAYQVRYHRFLQSNPPLLTTSWTPGSMCRPT